MMKFFVTDTNIFIDLYQSGMLDDFFQLQWEIHTADYVLYELEHSDQHSAIVEYVKTGRLKVDVQGPDDFITLGNFVNSQQGNSNLSVADCAVLLLAEKLKCALLTGDAKLKARAIAQRIEVYGITYILTALLRKKGSLTQTQLSYVCRNCLTKPQGCLRVL